MLKVNPSLRQNKQVGESKVVLPIQDSMNSYANLSFGSII